MKELNSGAKATSSAKVFGFWTCTSLVIGNMIGSGVFMLPASLALFGTISMLSWVFTAFGALVLALVFAKLGQAMPKAGGPYAYCREGLGDFVGFQVAFCYWIAVMISNAATIIALLSYLSVFWPALDNNHTLSLGIALICIWTIVGINILGVKEVGITQLVMTILKIVPLLAIGTIGLFWIKADNLAYFNISGQSNLAAFSAAAMMTLWAFLGLESATIPVGHVDKPKRTIPLATICGTLIAGVIYISSTGVVMGVIPAPELAHQAAPFTAAANVIFGTWAGKIVVVTAVLSCFSSTVGWVFLQAQIPMAAAKDGLFPQVFTKLSARNTPARGLIISGIIISVMVCMNYQQHLVDQFTNMIAYSVLAFLITYLYSTIAELVIFVKHRELFSPQRLTKSVIVSLLAFTYSLWTIIGSGQAMVFYGSFLLFGCAPIFAWVKWRAAVSSTA